jgi:hypothetical protein
MDLPFDIAKNPVKQAASRCRWDRSPDRPLPADALVDQEFVAAASRYTWRKNDKGYYYTRVARKPISLHRFVWLQKFGSLPSELDHINRIRTDCRIENLRPLTRSQNVCGRVVNRKNGLPRGVTKSCSGYYARFRATYLGHFKTAEEASAVYERSYHEYVNSSAA